MFSPSKVIRINKLYLTTKGTQKLIGNFPPGGKLGIRVRKCYKLSKLKAKNNRP
jgi:hypothetical protein